MTWACDHPVANALRDAAEGRFPRVDGVVEVVAPDTNGTHAVVSFSGHAFVMSGCDRLELLALGADGYGGATEPRVLLALAGTGGSVGSIDVVLVRRGTGADSRGRLTDRHDLDDHPRVLRSRHHRRNVRVLGDDHGFVTIGTGLVDRTEISVELTSARPGRGAGRALLLAALDHVAEDEFVFAQVAPGNAASLRAFLAAGFVPIGSEVLIEPA